MKFLGGVAAALSVAAGAALSVVVIVWSVYAIKAMIRVKEVSL